MLANAVHASPETAQTVSVRLWARPSRAADVCGGCPAPLGGSTDDVQFLSHF